MTVNGGAVTATGGYGGAGIGGSLAHADFGQVVLGGGMEAYDISDGEPGERISADEVALAKSVRIAYAGVPGSDYGPACTGGTIAEGEDNTWVVTPTGGVTEVSIALLPLGAKVAVPPTVTQVNGVADGLIRVWDGEDDITARCLIEDGRITRILTVKVGSAEYLSALWTSDAGETNAVENGCFSVLSGTDGVKVIFRLAHDYRFAAPGENGVRELASPLVADCEVAAPAVEGVPGTVVSPWRVGEATSAYLSEGGALVFVGTGAVDDFADGADVPWADRAADVKRVEIGEGVTRIGKNALAALPDETTVRGVPLSAYRNVTSVVTTVNGMALDAYNAAVSFLNVAEEWQTSRVSEQQGIPEGKKLVDVDAEVLPDGCVPVAKTELEAAGTATLTVVDGTAYLGVSVRTNADLTAEMKSWGKVKFGKDVKVDVSEDGTEIVVPVPANARSGFMILESATGR